MTDHDTYLHELADVLRGRGLEDETVRQAVEEVRSHLAEAGGSPVEQFGPAAAYAAALVGADPVAADGEGSEDMERRTFRATATDEMGILADLGADGWELTGVRDFGLHARRPVDTAERHRWVYDRRKTLRRDAVVREMAADGWQPCGRWVIFHYFKKPA